MVSTQPLIVQQYARAYTEIKFPEHYPIPKGKSQQISLFIKDPEQWASDLTTRFGRGTKKLNARLIPKAIGELEGELAKNKSFVSRKEVQLLYGAVEFLLGANKILESSLEICKDDKKLKKSLESVPFRKILSNRPLSVVIFGTVQAREIIGYGIEAHGKKDLDGILSYRAFVDEYLSYLLPFDMNDLPEEPIATFEEVDQILRRR